MIVEIEDNLNEVVIEFADTDNVITIVPVITRSSNAVGNINEENFISTENQTEFNIQGAPTSLKMVFLGRTLALQGAGLDYEYSTGTLSFSVGLITGTRIKVIY